MRTSALVIFATLVLVLSAALPAPAYWSSTGSVSAQAVTSTLNPPTNVTVTTTPVKTVKVTWVASTGDLTPEGYVATRSINADGSAPVPACSTSPIEPAIEPTCTDTVAPGAYYYTVTAIYGSWTSAGTPSGIVTVPEPPAPSVLGAAASYSVLAGTAVVNTLESTVSGDLGVSPGTAVSGFGPGTVAGDIRAGDAHATRARGALETTLTDLRARTPDEELAVGELGGLTLAPGTYHAVAALAVTGALTLDARGDEEAIFVFQTDAAFNTAAASTVVLVGGAQPSNVFWVVKGAAGTGVDSYLSGTILAEGAITLGDGTELIGRALSLAAVTLANNNIRFTSALPPAIGLNGGSVAATADTTPTISGTSNASATSPVSVRIAGQVLQTEVTVGGTWSVTTGVLGGGTHPVEAKVRDAAGNWGTAQQSLTIEVNPPPILLGPAESYSVLAATGIVSTGTTSLSGEMGVFPSTAVSGFPPGIVAGGLHAGDSEAAQAQAYLETAILEGSSRAPHTEIAGDLGDRTMHTGVHHSTAALAITGTLRLDAQGDPEAVFIFQSDAAFNMAAASTVVLINGAQATNVFWVATGAVSSGANSVLSGTILASGAITLGDGTELIGRALSRGNVTLASNSVTGAVPGPPPAAVRLAEPSPAPAPVAEPSASATPTSEPEPASAPQTEANPTTTPSSEGTATVGPTFESNPSTTTSMEPATTFGPSLESGPEAVP